jgi:hypothetical protein
MKKLATLVFVLSIFVLKTNAQCTSCNTTVSSSNGTSRSVSNNSKLCFTGGTYTGSITSIHQNGVICVGSGATFSPSSLSNFKGKIYVYGTANLPNTTFAHNKAEVINYGTVKFNGSTSFSSNGTITNHENAVMTFTDAVSLQNGSKITNDGTIWMNDDFAGQGSSVVTNNNVIRALKDFQSQANVSNYGYLYVGDALEVSGGNFTNYCKMFVKNGFSNSSSSTSNDGFIWIGGGTMQLSGNFSQASNGEVRGVNFSNSASVSGAGKYYFTGTTTNSGNFGNDGNGINFFDTNVSGGGSKKFDNQSTSPHSSVFRSSFTPKDTITANPAGCSSYQNCPAITADAGSNQSRCSGSTTFAMAANTVSGATGLWTVVSGTASIANTTSATTNVTVAVGNTATLRWKLTSSCASESDEVEITHKANPTAAVSGLGSICSGASTTITASGGGTYAWSTGATSAAISVSAAGTYTVTVTSNGCSSTASKTVTTSTSPTASISGIQSICDGANSTFTASGGTSYEWNTGATTAAISVVSNGTYRVTVSNAAGCTATATRTLTVKSAPAVSISGNNVLCNGGSSTFTASGGASYVWNTGASTAAIAVSTAATYTVTATAANSCTASANRTLVLSSGMTVTATPTASSCGLCDDGKINTNVSGGASPYTYAWSDGSSTSQNRTGLAPGSYTVTVSDDGGCTKAATADVYLPLAVNIAGLSNCNVQNGSATANPIGGKAPYTYLWNTGATSKTITGLVSGNYTVTVTDNLNATKTQMVAISNTMVTIGYSPVAPEICRGSSVQVTANGALSYSWSPATGLSATNIANPIASPTTTTTYTISTIASTSELVTNGNFNLGNTGFTSAYGFVSSAANIAANKKGLYPEGRYAVDTSAGFYHNNFTGYGNGGSGNFMIVNGATIAGQSVWSQTISVLPNTAYDFSTFISSVNEANPANLRFQINGVVLGPNIVASTTRGRWDQFIAAWNSGSNSTAEIAIINDNTIAGGNDFGLDNISFKSTCVSSSQITVKVNQPPSAAMSHSNITCNGLTNGAASVNASAGTSPYTYLWSNGSTATSLSNLANGTYTVTVRDSKTCTGTGSVTVAQPNVLAATANGTNVSCRGAANGSIALSPSGGTSPYTYAWSNGATVQNPANLAPGTYTVTVRDAKNCSITASATITQPSAVLASVLSVTNVTCNGASTGAISQTVSGGTSPYTYSWSTGVTTKNITASPAGTYSVTITDSRSCTLVKTETITEPVAAAIANAGADIANCNSLIFTMAGNSTPVGSGTWSVVSGIAVITAPSSPTSLVTIVGTTATLKWTISNGSCGSTSDNLVLTNIVASVSANAGADITRVNGSSTFVMNANNPGSGATGLWTLVSGNATIAAPTSRTSSVTVAVDNEAVLEWKVTNGGCVARDTILIRHLLPYSGCVAMNSGEWNLSTTWSGNCTGGNGYPGINDTAIISGKTITVSGNSSCKMLQMSNALGVATLNIQSAGQLTVAKDIEMDAAAQNTVRIDLAGDADLLIGGTVVRNQFPNNFGKISSSTSSTITFNGVTQQLIPTSRSRGTDAIEYQNVVFNNTSGVNPAFVAEGRVDVANTIALTKGCLDMGRDTIMLSNNSNTSVAGGSDNSYVMGQFCRYIGQSGKTYRWSVGRKDKEGEYWFELKNNLLVGTSYVCVEFDSVPTDSRGGISYSDQNINATQLAPDGIWRVEPNAQPLLGSYDVNASTSHFSGLVDNNFGLLKRPTRSAVGNWGVGGGLLPVLGGLLRTVTSGLTSLNSLSSFSEFGIGQGGGGSLPVKLTLFEAKAIENKYIKLKWITETEIDNMGFEVHRSKDGVEFDNIGWVNGNGSTTETKVYDYDDKSIDPNIRYYYRLKQIDFDAKFEYSPIATAEIKNIGGVLDIGEFTPNPAKATTSISVNTENDIDAEVIFFDMMGRVTKRGGVSMTKGSHVYYFDINELVSGNYVVAIVTPGSKHSKRLIVY